MDELIRAELREAVAQGEPRPDLWERVMAEAGLAPELHRRRSQPRLRRRILALVVCCLCMLALVQGWTGTSDVVLAMDRAVASLQSYHIVMESRSHDPKYPTRYSEIWVDGERYLVRTHGGESSGNDGEEQWRTWSHSKMVTVSPPFPDLYLQKVGLRSMLRELRYPHTIVGEDQIAGRRTTRLQITPPGGDPISLWIDRETNLPVQRDDGQTLTTYVKFEPNVAIDPSLFTLQVPEGYSVHREDDQVVASLEQAAAIAGFTPLVPQERPRHITAGPGRITLDYGDTIVTEDPAEMAVKAHQAYGMGTAAGGEVYIWQDWLIWNQSGVRVWLEGNRTVELGRQIAPELTLPDPTQDLVSAAPVKVHIDPAEAEAAQLQFDRRGSQFGEFEPDHAAWKWVNQYTWEGGYGRNPLVPQEALRMIANTGVEAVAEFSEGPYRLVYLSRLVRKDPTGIWFVVGYETR